MILHYIKFAFRSLFKDKIFSLINILGLTIGLTGTFVVSIYLINELSFDQFHKNKERIFRINTEQLKWNYQEAECPAIVSEAFQTVFPEIEKSTVILTERLKIEIGENNFNERVSFTNNNYFEIFNFPIIKGDQINPLNEINDVVITENMAIKLFASVNVIGNTFNIQIDKRQEKLKITAIMNDIPWNSSLSNEIIGNFELRNDNVEEVINPWYEHGTEVFILLNNGANHTVMQQKIQNYKSASMPDDFMQKFHLQSMNDLHLNSSHLTNNWDRRGSLKQLNLFITIGILLLIIAASNFIILSTAKSINRSREISLRKIMGASRKSIIKQIGWESGIFCFFIIPLGILLALLILPYAYIIIGSKVELHGSNAFRYLVPLSAIFIFLILFSGTYIALFTSKFKPLDAFRMDLSHNEKFLGRKIMIMLQLIIFITLVICVSVVQKQINFSKTMDQGFTKENLYMLQTPFTNYLNKSAFLNELKSNPSILMAGYASFGPPTFAFAQMESPIDNDPTTKVQLEVLPVDFDFIETLEFELIEGRSFERGGSDVPNKVCLINESVIKQFDFQNPIGRFIGDQKVIGVLKDFQLHNTKYIIKPMSIFLEDDYINQLYLRIPAAKIQETTDYIEQIWNKFYPEKPFKLSSFSTLQDNAYQDDSEFARNLTIFSVLAIFLSIMGLFGLTLFTIEKRSKEIGIRKIHGASINNIMMMINKEFALLVIIATILAWPVAWYFMDKWLRSFAYTIDFPYELYILSGLAAMLIVLLTVSIRSLKAAMGNPVDAIRYE